MKKKITRGISKDFAEAFKQSELYKLYREHKAELFIGVRNNYLNLYYKSTLKNRPFYFMVNIFTILKFRWSFLARMIPDTVQSIQFLAFSLVNFYHFYLLSEGFHLRDVPVQLSRHFNQITAS